MLIAVAVVLLGVAVVVPLVVSNRSGVERSSKPFADTYAATAFGELRHDAAVFIFGAELTQPLIYHQVVYHQRRDVVVIATDGVEYGWYRQQLSQRLQIALPAVTGSVRVDAAALITAVARVRPVYLDPQTAQIVAGFIGYRPIGLFSEFASGRGQVPVGAPGAVEQRLLAAERQAGFPNHDWTVWPNDYLAQAEYASAALQVARAYYQHRDYTGMRTALENELTIQPGDPIAEQDLAQLARISPTP
jgi:hypothetical protein